MGYIDVSIHRDELLAYCNQTLAVDSFKDYCPNGLQVEGKAQIHRLITGVTASQALIDAAVKAQADAILVHHGYFWRGEAAPLVGIKARRIRTLMQHGISLFAYHLPLDAHPSFGNNAQLAEQLGLDTSQYHRSKAADAEDQFAFGLRSQQTDEERYKDVEKWRTKCPHCTNC